MGISKRIAKVECAYHTIMINICESLTRVGLLRADKAEKVMKQHCMRVFDCMDRMDQELYLLGW